MIENLDERILNAIVRQDSKGLFEIIQAISYEISKGMSTFSVVSRPFYAAVLRQYAEALIDDMGELEREFEEEITKILKQHGTFVKIQIPSKEE